MLMKIIKILVLAVLMNSQAFSVFAQVPEKLVLAIQPTSTPEQLQSQAKELEAFLEERLETDVEILFPISYAGVIEALRFDHAQAAFMGSWPAAMARAHAGAEVLLAEVRDVIIDDAKIEAPHYFSYWVVAKDGPYQSLEDLKGKTAAFPSQISSSGYLAPMAKLVEKGFVVKGDGEADPKSFFGEVIFAGGYAQGWEALKAGQADVTVIAGDVPEKLYREVLENTRVLEKQGPIPSHVVVAGNSLDPAIREKLADALLALNAERDLMRKFVSGIFVRFEKAGPEHLAPLEDMMSKTGFEFGDKK